MKVNQQTQISKIKNLRSFIPHLLHHHQLHHVILVHVEISRKKKLHNESYSKMNTRDHLIQNNCHNKVH